MRSDPVLPDFKQLLAFSSKKKLLAPCVNCGRTAKNFLHFPARCQGQCSLMVGVGCGSTDAVVAQTMHQVMMAKSQGALKEGYKQGAWRVALPVVPWPLAMLLLVSKTRVAFMWTVAIFSVDLGVCVAAAASSCSALWVKTVLKG